MVVQVFDMNGDCEDVFAWVKAQVPWVTGWSAPPEPLSGGLMNEVWRLCTTPRELVLKWAPPYVASAPQIAMSSARILMESRALDYVSRDVRREEIFAHADGGWRIGVPTLYATDEGRAALLMAWAGDGACGLDAYPHAQDMRTRQLYEAFGGAIGRLHGLTSGPEARAELAVSLRNVAVQQTREQVQYRGVRGWLSGWAGRTRYAREELEQLSSEVEALGRAFVELPGRCLVMGDLWPRSVLVQGADDRLTLIDWEFAHFGQPEQDVAHLLAHLWMMGHQAGTPQLHASCARHWFDAYERALEGACGGSLWTREHYRRGVLHYIAEVLARTLGPFVTHEAYGEQGAKKDQAIHHVVSMWRACNSSSRADPRDCLLGGM